MSCMGENLSNKFIEHFDSQGLPKGQLVTAALVREQAVSITAIPWHGSLPAAPNAILLLEPAFFPWVFCFVLFFFLAIETASCMWNTFIDLITKLLVMTEFGTSE